MIALVAVLVANADGYSGAALARLLAVRDDRHRVIAMAIGAFAVHAAIAAAFGAAANRMIGQGIAALFVAFAMFGGAAALLWPGRRAGVGAEDARPALLGGRMFASQFGDRSHFLIGALAATSGAGIWAAAGGLIGWILALLPFLAFGAALAERREARLLRWAAAAILILWGLRSVMTAFGLIGSSA